MRLAGKPVSTWNASDGQVPLDQQAPPSSRKRSRSASSCRLLRTAKPVLEPLAAAALGDVDPVPDAGGSVGDVFTRRAEPHGQCVVVPRRLDPLVIGGRIPGWRERAGIGGPGVAGGRGVALDGLTPTDGQQRHKDDDGLHAAKLSRDKCPHKATDRSEPGPHAVAALAPDDGPGRAVKGIGDAVGSGLVLVAAVERASFVAPSSGSRTQPRSCSVGETRRGRFERAAVGEQLPRRVLDVGGLGEVGADENLRGGRSVGPVIPGASVMRARSLCGWSSWVRGLAPLGWAAEGHRHREPGLAGMGSPVADAQAYGGSRHGAGDGPGGVGRQRARPRSLCPARATASTPRSPPSR
jgi:hypothetical protein